MPTTQMIPSCNNFILIGAAGYVAPKHLKAIQYVGGNLLAAFDPHDSVGVLDSYFPRTKFFTRLNPLERYVERLSVKGIKVDYVSICSPNYLHDQHCRFALRIGAEAICEKPLTLNTRNLMLLARQERRYKSKINVILQLRLGAKVEALKELAETNGQKRHRVYVSYVTPRGPWYYRSWKGDVVKSGGLATNIGIHIFDLLAYLYGPMEDINIERKTKDLVAGILKLKSADVDFMLSTRQDIKPERAIVIDNESFNLSDGFTEMHNKMYERIIANKGFGIKDVIEATRIVEKIRKTDAMTSRTREGGFDGFKI
jgi:UDP-N-acetyl-2-amino-2-deoxyglucuronate dehydrogenase